MTELYVIEEYSPEDIEYEMSSPLMPVGTVVAAQSYAAEQDGWWRAVQLYEPYRDPASAPYCVGYFFKVKLRPVDPLEAFALLSKQQEQTDENRD